MAELLSLELLCKELQSNELKFYKNNIQNKIRQASVGVIFRFSKEIPIIENLPLNDNLLMDSNSFSQILELIKSSKIYNKNENIFQILFIQRASNKNDRWSGQLAFPGGKCDGEETDFEAIKREINEEIGLDFNNYDKAKKFIGKSPINFIHDKFQNKTLCVSVHFFLILKQYNLKINQSEIQDYKWVNFNEFLFVDNEKLSFEPRQYPISLKLLKNLVGENTFEKLKENYKNSFYPTININMNVNLWGLTYYFVFHMMEMIFMSIKKLKYIDNDVLTELKTKDFYKKMKYLLNNCITIKTTFKINDNSLSKYYLFADYLYMIKIYFKYGYKNNKDKIQNTENIKQYLTYLIYIFLGLNFNSLL